MGIKYHKHLLLRFSDSLLKSGDTISAHNQIIQDEGAVWFGKTGKPVSQHNLDILNDQVEENIPTYVYLVKGNRKKSTAYRGRLIEAVQTIPIAESNLVPSYYAEFNFYQYIKCWFKLSEIHSIDMRELKEMRVFSSVLPIQETLAKSSSGHFMICEIL